MIPSADCSGEVCSLVQAHIILFVAVQLLCPIVYLFLAVDRFFNRDDSFIVLLTLGLPKQLTFYCSVKNSDETHSSFSQLLVYGVVLESPLGPLVVSNWAIST